MRKRLLFLMVTQLFVFNLFAASADIEEKEIITRTLYFAVPTGDKQFVVDNIFGSITVTGYSGQEIQMSAQRRITAKSKDKIEEAKEKITLEISEENNLIKLYVNGPFRNSEDNSIQWRGFEKEGYKVIYDFDMKVPFKCDIEIKTVNEGEIRIRDLEGEFTVRNINGGITMEKISGAGHAYALNGDLLLDFQKNPDGDCYFGSLNGEVKLYFQSPLSADFQLKTFNGDFYTDFPFTYLPRTPRTDVEKNGKTVYKVGGTMGVRAGKGGPEIELNGFNGDMYILKK